MGLNRLWVLDSLKGGGRIREDEDIIRRGHLVCVHMGNFFHCCHGSAQGTLDTTVMTTYVESMISHGLFRKRPLVQALMWCLCYCSRTSHAHGHQSS
jgi:hypothetical protein